MHVLESFPELKVSFHIDRVGTKYRLTEYINDSGTKKGTHTRFVTEFLTSKQAETVCEELNILSSLLIKDTL